VRCPHRLYTAPPNRQLVNSSHVMQTPRTRVGATFALPKLCHVSHCGRFYIDIGGPCGVSQSRSNPPAFLFKRSRHPVIFFSMHMVPYLALAGSIFQILSGCAKVQLQVRSAVHFICSLTPYFRFRRLPEVPQADGRMHLSTQIFEYDSSLTFAVQFRAVRLV
jgi:hypothetical protein